MAANPEDDLEVATTCARRTGHWKSLAAPGPGVRVHNPALRDLPEWVSEGAAPACVTSPAAATTGAEGMRRQARMSARHTQRTK
eukprot:1889223-Alexandrium_andersonii.AAC.1